MIGVIANPADHDVVREFFELFKTPWELARRSRRYEVVLCAGTAHVPRAGADLIVVYAGEPIPFDAEAEISSVAQPADTMLSYRGGRIPLYETSVTFARDGRGDGIGLRDEASGRPAACALRSGEGVVVRIGYDLFREIRAALTTGQPPANAAIPSVELHIALLRDLIVRWAPPLVEIPPVPDGHPFIVCLTHDVDHPSIRRHRWDHTMFGFLYRALLGSLINVARGRVVAGTILTNWAAALKLPFVHLGVAKDFWAAFDRYLEIDAGLGSTFFVVPFRDDPGQTRRGPAPRRRASRYGARDIAAHIRRLTSAGGEIGVHGIDAWRDCSKGRQELDEVARITGAPALGVRMHWLYGDEESPATLEKAGFAYDATSGYNGTVGYRAGTTQVFKPLAAIRLLELPLHVMDTALFYPAHLHLCPRDARTRVGTIIDNAVHLGGTVTVNWHDRSIAPERLWGDFYRELIEALRKHDAWFATAGQAVAWFRKRRSAVFEAVGTGSDVLRAKVAVDGGDRLPGLRLRVHTPRAELRGIDALPSTCYRDVPLRAGIETVVPL